MLAEESSCRCILRTLLMMEKQAGDEGLQVIIYRPPWSSVGQFDETVPAKSRHRLRRPRLLT